MFHKPRGVVTSKVSQHGELTVFDVLLPLLPPHLRRLSWEPVGRLDKDTTGLLLFTTDGGLIHHATHPQTGLPKTYRVLAKGLITPEQVDALKVGVPLTGGLGTGRATRVEALSFNVATTWLELTLTEGKNREVRRMLLAIHSQVIRLQRVAVGKLRLDIPEACWRMLEAREITHGLAFGSQTKGERARGP